MAKSDLLKEAIADAKAVKETALANAKIALEEAFAPRIQSMLSAKLSEEMYEDEEMEAPAAEAPVDEHDVMYEPEAEGGMDAEMELDAPAPEAAPEMEMDMEVPAEEPAPVADDMEMEGMMIDADEDPADAMSNEDLELEAIIRELEEDLDEEITEEVVEEDAHNKDAADSTDGEGNDLMAEPKGMKNEEFNIDEIIEEILSEDEDEDKDDEKKIDEGSDEAEASADDKSKELEEDLNEAYETIDSLRSTINEVNLLNAKLLYTNKLFRNFELSENQKMTVIENFDRAGNTREVKSCCERIFRI